MGRLSRVDWTETSWCWVVFLGDPGRWVELVVCSAQHWCRNPGDESHNGLGSLVVPCYGLSARYFPFWRVGLGSCRPLPASRAEAWNVHGVAHVVTGPCPGGAAALPWVTCCVYCYLPGFGLWGIVAAQYIWTLRRRLYHLTCLSALDLVVWGMLDGATRGRCLIVLWGRGALCQRAGFWYTAVVMAVGCMPGCGLGGIWMCTVYYIDFVSSMYGHWYWRAVVLGPSFWISRAGESGGVVHVAWSLGSWEAGVASECRLCWCLHTGTWCTWGIDQLSCVYFSLYWDLSSRCIGPGMTS